MLTNPGFVAWHSSPWHCDTSAKATKATVRKDPAATNYRHKMERNKHKNGQYHPSIPVLTSCPFPPEVLAVSAASTHMFLHRPITFCIRCPHPAVSEGTISQGLLARAAAINDQARLHYFLIIVHRENYISSETFQ